MITIKEFKRKNHFRNCADRNCLNCKWRWKNAEEIRSVCWFDRESIQATFRVTNFTVCDNWELDRNFKP